MRVKDPVSVEKLVHGGLLLSSLALSDIVSRKFRFLTYGVAGLMTVSAFTGWSPISLLLEKAEEDEEEPTKVGIPPIATLGVPHRIPEEAVGLHHEDRPAPSPEGELGLAD